MLEQNHTKYLLWLGGILLIAGPAFHYISIFSHVIFMLSFVVVFIALLNLMRHKLSNPLTQFGLTFWAVGSFAGMIAVLLDIFVVEKLLIQKAEASADLVPLLDAQLNLIGTVGGLFVVGIFTTLPLALIFLGSALLQRQGKTNPRNTPILGASAVSVGVLGLVSGVGMAQGLSWWEAITPIFLLLMAIWMLIAGFFAKPKAATSGQARAMA